MKRAERRAAPKPVLSLQSPIALSLSKGGPARIPQGDRQTYPSGEGQT